MFKFGLIDEIFISSIPAINRLFIKMAGYRLNQYLNRRVIIQVEPLQYWIRPFLIGPNYAFSSGLYQPLVQI